MKYIAISLQNSSMRSRKAELGVVMNLNIKKFNTRKPGPSCSKLAISLVNVSLKL